MSNKNNFRINRGILYDGKYYRMFVLGCLAFLLAFGASAILTPVQASDALEGSATVTARNSINGYYISLTSATDLSVSLDAVPAGTRKASTDTVTTITNVPTGYKLYISTEDNNIYNANDAKKVSNHFSPVGSVYPETTTLSANTWGFNLSRVDEVPDGAVGWSAVPTEATKIKETGKATAEAGDDTPISYGFMADTTLPAGTYSTMVTYTVYAENVEEFPYMQDFTAEECGAMEEDEFITLTDNRDGKSYRVTKYADGNCWMSQNLALDPVDGSGKGITLTIKNTNISMVEIPSGRYTFPDGTVITGEVERSADVPQAYTGYQNNTTANCNTEANPYCVVSEDKYGNLYNWPAATLGVGTTDVDTDGQVVYSSVCPKGWRLPDSGDDTNYGANAPDKSYGKLMYAALGLNAPSSNPGGSYVRAVQQSPLSFPLAGLYGNLQGMNGMYWSRAARSDARASMLDFQVKYGYFFTQESGQKEYSVAVRCVFEGAIEDGMKMQNVTIDMCNSLDESTDTADNRRMLVDGRDGKSYRVSKLADGNCWMVSNLALDPVDGEGRNRTLTTADTNIDIAEITSGEYTFPDDTLITSGATSVATKEQIYNTDALKTTTSCGNYAYCVTSDEPYGNFYNWMAATLGEGTTSITTGEVKSSVCPKGWRLPDSGTSSAYGANAPDKSYGKIIYSVLGFNSETAAGMTGGAYAKAMQQSPLFFSLAGGYLASRIVDQGVSGNYWSRTVSADTDAYRLYFSADGGSFYPQNGYPKKYGFPVRCVLGE